MFGRFERMVAARYLRARRGERFVSVIAIFSLVGIALGVATLIIVMSVMNGFKSDLLSRILGFNGDLSVYGEGQSIFDYETLSARIAKIAGVVSASPVVEGQVLLSSGPYSGGGVVRGVSETDLRRFRPVSGNIKSGTLDDFKGDDAIAIGLTLAQRTGLVVGNRVTLISPHGAATAFGTVPRVRAYQVVAIFQAGVNDYDASYVFLPLHAAQLYFQLDEPPQVSQIQVGVADPERVEPVTRRISDALSDQRLRVLDWTQSNNSFFGAVQVEQNVMFLILTLIIVVAAFNVISSLIMMVKDKTRDIAVLRTIGARRGAIMRIFLMCGASIGATGTVAGTLLGVVFCLNIERLRQWLQSATGTTLFNPEVYYLEHLPAKLEWDEVAKVIVMALSLSVLATLYPSWRAARTDPVEALRHE